MTAQLRARFTTACWPAAAGAPSSASKSNVTAAESSSRPSRATGGSVAGEGGGPGLPIAQLIVRSHEGTLNPRRIQSRGSIIRVRLPLATPTFKRADAERSKPVRVS